MKDEYKHYYVVGIYHDPEEVPTNIFKVTYNFEDAANCYFKYWENPKCYVGYYNNNRLVSLSHFKSYRFDGPGIFKGGTKSVTIDEIESAIDNF